MEGINPQTEIGKAQIAAIGWAQDQMNKALQEYFGDKYRLQKGLRIEFRLGLDLKLNQTVKFEILSLEPTSEDKLQAAIDEAKARIEFPKQEVVEEKK